MPSEFPLSQQQQLLPVKAMQLPSLSAGRFAASGQPLKTKQQQKHHFSRVGQQVLVD